MKTGTLLQVLTASLLILAGCSGSNNSSKGRDASTDGKEAGAGSLDGSKADRSDSRLSASDAGGNVIPGADGGALTPLDAGSNPGAMDAGTAQDVPGPALDTALGQNADTQIVSPTDGAVDANQQTSPQTDAGASRDTGARGDGRNFGDGRTFGDGRSFGDGREAGLRPDAGSRDVQGRESRRRDAPRFQDAGDAAEAEDAPLVSEDAPVTLDAGRDSVSDADDAL